MNPTTGKGNPHGPETLNPNLPVALKKRPLGSLPVGPPSRGIVGADKKLRGPIPQTLPKSFGNTPYIFWILL